METTIVSINPMRPIAANHRAVRLNSSAQMDGVCLLTGNAILTTIAATTATRSDAITTRVRRSNSAVKTVGAFRVVGAVILKTTVEMDQTKRGAQEVLLERMGRQLMEQILPSLAGRASFLVHRTSTVYLWPGNATERVTVPTASTKLTVEITLVKLGSFSVLISVVSSSRGRAMEITTATTAPTR